MDTKTTMSELAARRVSYDKFYIFYAETGEAVTRIDANVYPIGSELSARYEHPRGIYLTESDVRRLKIEIEK